NKNASRLTICRKSFQRRFANNAGPDREMASRNNRSGGSEPTWCRVLFYVRRLVLVYQPSRRAVDSATVDYRFRGHGSLAKSGPGSDGDGYCRRIFLAKPLLQPRGVFPLVDCYLTD